MLQAHIDDSSSGKRGIYVLAGFVAPVESWAAFSIEWKEILDTGPAPLRYFKMNEAHGLSGQFRHRHWSASRRDACVNALVKVINRHALFSIVSALDQGVYEAIFKGKYQPAADKPFNFMCQSVVTGIWEYLAAIGNKPDPVELIFDNEITNALTTPLWELGKENVPAHVRPYIGGPPISCDDEKVLPLQAADLLAWSLRRSLIDARNGKKFQWKWEPIGNHIPMMQKMWSPEKLLAVRSLYYKRRRLSRAKRERQP